jgi:hypothetical protein
VGDKTELAYRRSDALAKRRKPKDEWAEYLDSQQLETHNARAFAKAERLSWDS